MNVRLISVLLVVVNLLFLVSCDDREKNPLLSRIENMMELYPDSALLLLKSNVESVSRSQQEEFNLLLSYAKYKNNISIYKDFLLTGCIGYYLNERNDAQFPRLSKITSFPDQGLCER